jgi:hypothetical protein
VAGVLIMPFVFLMHSMSRVIVIRPWSADRRMSHTYV